MLTRISSFHNYQAVQNDLRRQEAKIHHNQAQLASGKKLLSPAENPLATHYIQNIEQQEEQTRQYLDAIVMVRNRLEQEETVIDNAEQFADKAKRLTMEMINGSLDTEDRGAIARELQEIFNNLLSLSNMQDESGNYIFAGTKSKNQPFFRDNSGTVVYTGDDYQRKMKITNSMEIPFNDPGSLLFMQIENPYGDYQPDYQLQEGSELLLSHAKNTDAKDDANYQVSFVELKDGNSGYVLERNGKKVASGNFDPKTGIQYESLTIHIKGEINTGDQIRLTPAKMFNVFDSFKQAVELSKGRVDDASVTAKLHQMTEQFSRAFTHFTKARTDIGARLNTLDIQTDQHEDFKLSLAKSKSQFVDLDYAEAVIEFNENTRALQASHLAFGKTKDLTLFNYL